LAAWVRRPLEAAHWLAPQIDNPALGEPLKSIDANTARVGLA
jgi:hypothetical protein